MTKFKSSGIKESIANALHGLRLAFFSQRNFVIEVVIAFAALVLAFFLKFSATDFCIVILMITLVLVCELLNSAIEFTLDAVYKNNYSRLVEMAKDMSAGMVLLVAFSSAVLGCVLYGSYVLKLIY